MSRTWKIQVLRSWDEVEDPSFVEQWTDWAERSRGVHVFNHPRLLSAWTDAYRSLEQISPHYVIAEKEGALVFLPLVLWRRNWKNAFVRTIIPAGYSDYDYHDPLVVGDASGQLLQVFWKQLLQDVIRDAELRYDMVDLRGMRVPGKHFPWVKEETCPYADLRRYRDYEDYFGKLGKSLRKDIRKRTRMLEEHGRVDFHVYGPGELAAALDALAVFLGVHANRWPNAYKAPGFHEELLRKTLPAGIAHFSEIRIDNEPVSWELGFRYRKRAYSYMPAYLKEYANCSPGKVHLAFLIEDGFSNGVEIFDFMRGSEEYKEKWTDDEVALYRHGHRCSAPQSRLKLAARDMLLSVKGGFRAIPMYFIPNGIVVEHW